MIGNLPLCYRYCSRLSPEKTKTLISTHKKKEKYWADPSKGTLEGGGEQIFSKDITSESATFEKNELPRSKLRGILKKQRTKKWGQFIPVVSYEEFLPPD